MKIYIGGCESVKNIPVAAEERIIELAEKKGKVFIAGFKTEIDKLFINIISAINGKDGDPVIVYIEDESMPVESDHGEYEDDDAEPGKAVRKSRVDEDYIVRIPPRFSRVDKIIYRDMFKFPADDRAMLKDADRGLFVWDGRDQRIFMNILELVFCKKPVEVVLGNELIKIDEPEDLRRLVPEPGGSYTRTWDNMPEDLYQKTVKEVVPSEYMRDFLLSYSSAPKDTVIDLILSSPVSIIKKLEILKDLSITDDEQNEMIDKVCKGRRSNWCEGVEGLSHDIHTGLIKKHVNALSEVLDGLNAAAGEFFVLKRIYHRYPDEKAGSFFEAENKDQKDMPGWMKGEKYNRYERLGEFTDYDTAKALLKDYIKNENITLDSLCWFKLEKWTPNPDYRAVDKPGVAKVLVHGKGEEFNNPYNYYFISEELIYFSKNSQRKDGTWYENNDYFDNDMLNLPAPYKAGDIVKIDCRPFAPVTFALMLEDGTTESTFHCGGRGLFRTHTNKWKPHFFYCYHPFTGRKSFSSYYGVSEFTGELPEEYIIFKELQEMIGGDAQKAKNLLLHIMNLEETDFSDGITDEEFSRLLETDWVNTPAPDEEEIEARHEENFAKKQKESGVEGINIEIVIGAEEDDDQ